MILVTVQAIINHNLGGKDIQMALLTSFMEIIWCNYLGVLNIFLYSLIVYWMSLIIAWGGIFLLLIENSVS